jgi:hypothetical protein
MAVNEFAGQLPQVDHETIVDWLSSTCQHCLTIAAISQSQHK